MKRAIQVFKKDPFLTVLISLAVAGAMWFFLAPGEFKCVWSKNPLIVEIIKEHNIVEQKSKLTSIGYYYPYFPYFAEIVFGSQQPKAEWMDTYYLSRPYIFRTYYQKVVEMFPDNDAAHFLLGYCEYYKGEPSTACAQYEKSIGLNQAFFWTYYNLGVIYFQQGDFLKSAEIVTKAFGLKDETTLEILHQGPFYAQIWSHLDNPSQVSARNLNEGKKDALFLLAVDLVKAGHFDQALQIIQYIRATRSLASGAMGATS